MARDILNLVIESYAAPRAAMRRVLDRVGGWRDVGVVFALSYMLTALITMLTATFDIHAAAAPSSADTPSLSIASFFLNFVFLAGLFFILSLIVTGIGKIFGGEGSTLDLAAAHAWHSLITAIFAPVVVYSLAAGPGWIWVGLLLSLASLWLMANFIAEAHRFDSAWKVAAGIVVFLGVPTLAALTFVTENT